MAKREQVVEETLGLIAQAQAEYEKIVEEVRVTLRKHESYGIRQMS